MNLPDMGSVGTAASKLSDPQTVMFYFLLVLIVVLVTKDMIGAWRHARIADKFASSAAVLAKVMADDAAQATAQWMFVQRELSDAKQERARVLEVIERAARVAEKNNALLEQLK